MEQLNIVGREIFFKLVDASYWFFGFLILFDILKNVSRRNFEGVVKALINGAMSFAAIYFITTILDVIKGAFN